MHDNNTQCNNNDDCFWLSVLPVSTETVSSFMCFNTLLNCESLTLLSICHVGTFSHEVIFLINYMKYATTA